MKIEGFNTQEYRIDAVMEGNSKNVEGTFWSDAVAFGSSLSSIFNEEVENISYLGDSEGVMDSVKSKAAMLKDNMTAIFNRMETGTVVSMDEEGIDVNNTEADELVTVVEQIQIKLAMYCDDFEPTVNMNSEAIKNVMGAAASFTANRSLDDGTKEYLIKNKLQPTVGNIYIAGHAGVSNYSHASLKENEWQEILPQVNKVIEKTGLPLDDRTQNMGKWLVNRDIPLTTENLSKLVDLENIHTDDWQERVKATVMEGYKPSATLLTNESLPWEESVKAINTIEKASEANIMWWSMMAQTKNLTELKFAIDNHNEMIPDKSNEKYIISTRQLQEVRLMMTINAGRTLEKNNISINTVELSRLVEELKSYELEQMNSKLDDTTPISMNEMEKANDALLAFMNLKTIPAMTLGMFIESDETVNANNLEIKGRALAEEFTKAQKMYESLSTEIRKDLGDNVAKAVSASMDDILNSFELDNSLQNQRAIRILAYNDMEINEHNIFRVKAMDESVNTLFNRLNPSITLEMIREGKDILSTPVDELSEYLLAKQEKFMPKEEKYSEFLYRMDKKKEIDSYEREKFIGIYSMVHKFQKDGMNVVGSLLNQGLELNMGNLLTAFYSRKDKGLELAVDDSTPTIHVKDKVTYYKNIFGKAQGKITPHKLEKVSNEIENMSPEQFVESMESEVFEDDVLYEKYVEDFRVAAELEPIVYKFISENHLPKTLNSIMSVRDFFNDEKKVFTDYEKETAESTAEDFFAVLDDKESLQEEYKRIAENTRKILEEKYITKDTFADMDALRRMGGQINMIQSLSKNNYFCIPYEGENSEGIIHLRVMESEENKGTFNIKLKLKELGNVTIEGKVEINSVKAVILCENEALSYMEERLPNIYSKLNDNGYDEVSIAVNVAKEHPTGIAKTLEKTETKRIYTAAKIFVSNMAN